MKEERRRMRRGGAVGRKEWEVWSENDGSDRVKVWGQLALRLG